MLVLAACSFPNQNNSSENTETSQNIENLSDTTSQKSYLSPVENPEARKIFERYAEKASQKSEWISFDFEYMLNGELLSEAHPSYCYKANDQAFYLYYDSNLSTKETNEVFYMINVDNNTLIAYSNVECDGPSPYHSYKATCEGRLNYLSLYFQSFMEQLPPSNNLIRFLDATDTVVNGISCLDIKAISPKYEWTSGLKKGVRQEECHFWINKQTEMIDSLVTKEILDKTSMGETCSYIVKNVSFDDRSAFFDSIFDLSSERYKDFTIEDQTAWSKPDMRSDTITENLLNFPIVSLNGDTITLANTDGWVLLNMWALSCGNCIKELGEWGREKDSLGYRILSKEGIKILSVNYLSDNIGKIKEIADRTNSTDIMHYAKGMGDYINLPYIGYNFLLSPNKKLVYKSPYIGSFGKDYSELLKAKADYEATHKN